MKRLRANPLSESLPWDRLETMAEVRRKVITHIDAKETMKQKMTEERHSPTKSCPGIPRGDTIHPRFQKDEHRYVPYAASGFGQKKT